MEFANVYFEHHNQHHDQQVFVQLSKNNLKKIYKKKIFLHTGQLALHA
jgi:hypothetical protein